MTFGELKRVEITVLADNNVLRPGKFLGEYGFSAFIKAVGDDELGILLDTGCGEVIEHNVELAKIGWDEINYIVLSHRHFDHTGGLLKVLEHTKAPIIAHPDLFEPSFLWVRNRLIDGSLPFSRTQLEEKGARFYFIRDMLKLMDGVAVSGEIPRVSFEKSPETFKLEEGRYVNDPMLDDMAIFAKTKSGGVVITGCAHSGVVNTAIRAKEVMGDLHAVVGGFHLIFSPPERIEKTADELVKMANVLSPTHCSGAVIHGEIAKRAKEKLMPVGSGVKLVF
ncbi:hypothetical protein DRP05_07175 [Archaeoglobales archaeon]|nr:MAG: hypothetical protein DRP05_07175 [Archaeoglobales archaeon]